MHNLYYFGMKFMHTAIECPTVAGGGSGLILEQIKQTLKYQRFCRLIKEDLESLQKGGFVRKRNTLRPYALMKKPGIFY